MSDPFFYVYLEMSSEHLNLFKVCMASARISTGGNQEVTDFFFLKWLAMDLKIKRKMIIKYVVIHRYLTRWSYVGGRKLRWQKFGPETRFLPLNSKGAAKMQDGSCPSIAS